MPVERPTSSPNPADPLPPFNAWPVQWSDPNVGFAWYTEPGTLITQVTVTHATARVSTVLSDWVDLVLERHREEIHRCGGLLGIHDWRRFRNYDSEARRRWMERIQRRPKGYLRKGIIIVGDNNPLIKMAVSAANMVVSLASGGGSQFEIASHPYQVLQRYDVQRPRS